MLLAIAFGCAPNISNPNSGKDEAFSYPDLSKKIYCRGKGYVVSRGNINGRLSFTFTSSRESTYIEFRDLIGRKTLFLTLSKNTINAWDIRNNRSYDQESLVIAFPFFELIKPNDLINFLWGKMPKTFAESDNILNNKINNGQIQFSSQQTENGILINSVSFNFEEENETIDLFVESRDFDSQYPHLIREIPKSIIQAKEKQ